MKEITVAATRATVVAVAANTAVTFEQLGMLTNCAIIRASRTALRRNLMRIVKIASLVRVIHIALLHCRINNARYALVEAEYYQCEEMMLIKYEN